MGDMHLSPGHVRTFKRVRPQGGESYAGATGFRVEHLEDDALPACMPCAADLLSCLKACSALSNGGVILPHIEARWPRMPAVLQAPAICVSLDQSHRHVQNGFQVASVEQTRL